MASPSSFTTPLSAFNPSPRRTSAPNARFTSQISTTTSSSSLYETLGIQTTATCQEIKQAYRKLARVSHPDVTSSGDDDFMRIHLAYATLSDPEKRADYDRSMLVNRSSSYGYARAADTTPFSHRRWETDQCW